MSIRLRSGIALVATAALAGALAVGTSGSVEAKPQPKPPKTMPIQLLAINDFHGNLEPPTGSSGTVTRLNPDGTTTASRPAASSTSPPPCSMARAGPPELADRGAPAT